MVDCGPHVCCWPIEMLLLEAKNVRSCIRRWFSRTMLLPAQVRILIAQPPSLAPNFVSTLGHPQAGKEPTYPRVKTYPCCRCDALAVSR